MNTRPTLKVNDKGHLEIGGCDTVELVARFPISPATTAKPFPASPALAASMDAFNDKRLV